MDSPVLYEMPKGDKSTVKGETADKVLKLRPEGDTVLQKRPQLSAHADHSTRSFGYQQLTIPGS